MKIKRLNWLPWAGLLLSLVALFSYPFVFVRWPVTRDFPWVNLLIFAFAAVLLWFGIRRAFAAGRRWISKIAAFVVTALSVAMLGFFLFTAFVASHWLPAAHGAPQVGQKAPDFTLADINDKPVSLSEVLSTPLNGKAPKGVLLIFYRGYW